jgi:methyl-accepting chemotaxis protein WspA
MQAAMTHMEEASRTISGRLQTIHEKADNITGVVTTITKVADQTNLLSLNAAIEAEKAGEYGRGFTVVAREIRRLADQTAVATLDIEQMVKEMQSAVSAGVMEMDKFIQDVQHSAEDVERISSQLNRIIEQVQALSPRFEEVNLAMGHQSEHARDINTAMLNLSDEMRQTTESLRESFLAIGQLNEAAGGLQEEMSRFRVK